LVEYKKKNAPLNLLKGRLVVKKRGVLGREGVSEDASDPMKEATTGGRIDKKGKENLLGFFKKIAQQQGEKRKREMCRPYPARNGPENRMKERRGGGDELKKDEEESAIAKEALTETHNASSD